MKAKVKELQFQIDAADNAIKYLVNQDSFALQSPTGSGKTFITSLIIEKVLQDPILSAKNIAFLFIAPSVGKLDHQGFLKISDYVKRGWVSGFATSYIGTGEKSSKNAYLQNIDKFKNNTVYFVGWSLFGKNSNLTNIDSEKNNLFRVIENTKNAGTEIILIIDEAHREVQSKSDTKLAAIEAIKPYKRIEVSATLDQYDYCVSLDQVRSEAAIKKNVEVSFGETDATVFVDSDGEIEQMIYAAKNKQEEIRSAYFKRGISMVPLILIQIPDKQKVDGIDTDDYYLTRVKNALKGNGYIEGKNYAIWLNDDKTTKIKEELTNIDSPFEVLVFKQAIATGWDIPRANILIRLREPQSPKFDIQTLGRILRNPFFRYYNNELIDNAFVFTRDKKYADKILKEDFTKSVINTLAIDLSEKGRKSNVSFKTMQLNTGVDIYEVVENALQEFKELYLKDLIQNIKTSDIEDDGSFRSSFSVASEFALDANILRAKASQVSQQQVFNFNNKKDLFTIYLKYKAVTSQNKSYAMLFDEIADLLSEEELVKKKDYYKFVQSYVFRQFFKDKSFMEIVKELVDKHIGRLANTKDNKKYQTYNLPLQMKYKEHDITQTWDGLNSYELSFETTEKNKDSSWSSIEKRFVNFFAFLKHLDNPDLHLFRNNVDDVSYKIDYLNNLGKVGTFYPDFIFVNDASKRVWIIDTKGRGDKDIDRQSASKFEMAWEEQNALRNDYAVEFLKATINNGEKFEFKGANNLSLSEDDFIKKLKVIAQ